MPRSSRLETHDHSTCGFMAWCRKSGAQVAGKLENSTAIVAADGEKSARIDLKVLPAFDKCPNEGKDEQLRSLLQHSFDELKLRYDGHVARFDCLALCCGKFTNIPCIFVCAMTEVVRACGNHLNVLEVFLKLPCG